MSVLLNAPPLAHAGHWATSLIYLVPVVVIVAAIALQSWRERRVPDQSRPKRSS